MDNCGVCHRPFSAGDPACVIFEIVIEDPALHLGIGSVGRTRAQVIHRQCMSGGRMAQRPVTKPEPAKPPDRSTQRADVLAAFMEANQ